MENDSTREIQRHAVNLDQVTVKQEIIDEEYNSKVSKIKTYCDIGHNCSKISELFNIHDGKDNTQCFDKIFTSVTKPKLETEILAKEVGYDKEGKEYKDLVKISGKEPEIKKEKNSDSVIESNDTKILIEKGCLKLKCPVEVKKENEDEILNDVEVTYLQSEEGCIKVETDIVSESFENVEHDKVGCVQTDIKTEDKGAIEDDSDSNVVEMVVLMEKCPVREDHHSLLEKKGYVCQVCKKTFVKKSSLSSHEMTHTGETPFKCQFCQKGFNVRSNLNVHLRIHTGQRPHECEICQKTFRQAGQLKTHERIHKGEKPYTCSMCTSSFRSSSALITHQRTHTGERPFPCDLCSRSFSTSTSLKTHRITHSGTMLYDCPVCGRQFNRKNNLNVHIKRHNKNRKFSCPKCSNGFVMRAHLLGHLKRAHKIELQADQLKCSDLLDGSDELSNGVETTEEYNIGEVHLKYEQDIDMKTENVVCDNTSAQCDINGHLDTSIKDEV